MKSLNEILWSPSQRDAFAADLVTLVDRHLAGVRGLRGIGLKTGMAVLKAAKPDLLDGALRRNAPQFIAALEPLYAEFQRSADRDFSVFLQKHADEGRDALLAMADARLEKSRNGALQSAYRKMRGSIENEIGAAMPALGKLIRGYM
ncbi:DUF6918 family protein [Solimonas terrae]|uniref:Uncharacterized protein n=1 Tax=Solimonas terrae TaxID=1396819 RepID=A0A6M2BNU8_9GAMM|nr:hypothetical protein [Solimonas terrae]NGY03703.1 hypothetical protein [Solimonas terrae]